MPIHSCHTVGSAAIAEGHVVGKIVLAVHGS
jgi:hypothetical protein